jgi:tetratricopeptide (TPR) repeat protein
MRTKRIAIVAIWMILALASCHRKPPVRVAVPPPAPRPPAPAPAPAAPAPASPSAVTAALERADRAFANGAYDDAIRDYEQSLRLSPSSNQHETALFRLGLAYVLHSSTNPDWQRATMLFRQVVDEHPNGTFKPAAALILSLHSDLDQAAADSKVRDQRIRQLSTELDRLKQIDAQRRTRP